MRIARNLAAAVRTSAAWALILSLGLVLSASAASAWTGLGCKYSSPTLTWQDSTTGDYWLAATYALSAWDSTATPLTLIKVSGTGNVRVTDGNFGNVGFDGVTYDAYGQNPVVNSCGGGTWDTTIVTWLNKFYADNYSTTKRKSVWVHELGHAWGLAHWSKPACANVTIMQPDTHTRYDVCGISTPRSDDVNGVNAIY